MLGRNITDLEVYTRTSKHPYIELMKLVYEDVTVCGVLKFFSPYIQLLTNSWCCSQLKALDLFSYITNSMEHSPTWKANRCSVSQEISHILWYPKVCYHIQRCSPPLPILSQFQSKTLHLTSWTSFHLLLGLPSCFFLQTSPTLFVYTYSFSHTCHMSHPSHYSGCNHINNIRWAVQFTKLFIMQSLPVNCYLVPFRRKYLSLLPILAHPQPMFLAQCETPNYTST
jgi:hypothetical protein